MIVKFLHHLFQREDLPVALRGPSQKGHIVDHGLRDKALLDQILIGGMAASLGQLLVLLVGDERTVDVHRHLPAESVIEAVVLGGRGKVLISPYHMGDAHEMVVHHVGKIVGGIAVGLDQDHIVQFGIVHRNVPVNLIVEGGSSLRGVVLADDKRLSGL